MNVVHFNILDTTKRAVYFISHFLWDSLQHTEPEVIDLPEGNFFATKKELVTLPETNITPENGWLEYYFPIGEAYFQGLR